MGWNFQQHCQLAWGRPPACKVSAQMVKIISKVITAEGRGLLCPQIEHKPLGTLITGDRSQLRVRFSGYRSRNLTCLPDVITHDLTLAAALAGSALHLCFPVSPVLCLCWSGVGLLFWFTVQFVSRRMHFHANAAAEQEIMPSSIFLGETSLHPAVLRHQQLQGACDSLAVEQLQGMEIWGKIFCLLWSFRLPSWRYSFTYVFLIVGPLWNPIFIS